MADSERLTILPIPVAILLCDQVISDEFTHKKSLIGIFDRVWCAKFPTQHGPIGFYARLTDGEGEYDFKVQYVKANDESMLGEVTGNLTVRERHLPIDLPVMFPPLAIPEPGIYEFRLWIDDHYIQRTGFTALPQSTQGGQS